ncbi:MAG: PKD domain-containing protein, partial [Flavobacteriia bacterium]|nr:PKD domain-containing protein [Flavobacteriia bacterium]
MKINRNLFVINLVIFLFVNSSIWSQDNCATATPVVDLTGVICATSTVSSTNALAAGGCEEGTYDTWFSFVAQGSVASVNVTGSTSGFRPEILLVESSDNTCAGTFSLISCMDGVGNYNNLAVSGYTGLVPGNTYWFVISSDQNTTSGTLSVCVTNPPTPINDACEGAITLPLDGTCLVGTNVNANDEITGVVGCQDGAVATHPDVFYSFVADKPSISFNLIAGTMTGTAEIVVYSGDCVTTFTEVASLCGPMTLTDTVNALVVGATYYVGISTNATEGTFQICATSFTPIATPGQDCPVAQSICSPTGFVVGTVSAGGGTITGNGSNEDLTFAGSCFGGQESRSQWYKFSVNTAGDLEFQIDPILWGDDYDWAVFDITTTGCVINNNVPVACNWSGCYGMTGITSAVGSYTGGTNNTFDYYYGNPAGPGDCLGAPGGADNGNGASQWENAISLIAGHEYAVLINNYGTAASDNGFNFNFNGTGAGIGVLAGFAITSGGCTNYNVTVADTIAALNSVTYTWDWGDGTGTAVGPSTNTHDYTAAGPGTYTVHTTVTEMAGCIRDYYTTVSVGTTLAAHAGVDAAICSGSLVIGDAPSATGGNGVYTYSWSPSATLSNATVSNPTASPVAPTTYTLTVTDGLGCTATDAVSITMSGSPVITNATTTQTICSGTTASIIPTSSVVGTTYSWTSTPSAGTITGNTTPGTGNVSDVLNNSALVSGTVTYTITPTGPAPGFCVGAPVNFVVTVDPIPTITNATTTQAICSGATASIVPTSGVASTTFAWTASSSAGTTTGFTTPGSGNISNVLSNSASTTGTVTYVITPTGPAPSLCVGTPVNFVVTVNPIPTVTNATTTQAICSGSTASIIPTSGVVGTTFAWTSSTSAGTTTGNTTPGTGNISDVLSNSATTSGTATYVVTPTGPAPTSCVGAPVNFVVTVNPIPAITNAPTTQAICSGSTASIVPTSNVASTTFAWTSSTSAGTITGNTTPGTGNVSDILSNSATTSGTATYVVTPTGPAPTSCVGTPVNFVVTVNPTPTFTVSKIDPTVCNASDGSITLSGLANSTGYNLTYTDGVTVIGANPIVTDASGNYIITGLNFGSYSNFIISNPITTCTYTIVPSISLLNPGAPDVFDITDVVQCGGTYTLPTITGTSLTGSESYYTGPNGTGTAYAAGFVVNAPGFPALYIYDINGACADEEIFSITINTTPTITNAPTTQAICSGSIASIIPTSSVASTTFAWTSSTSAGTITGNTTPGTGNISETLSNSASTSGTATYVVTPTGPAPSFCVGTPVNFVVTVNPIPTVTNATTTQAICSGTSASIIPTSGVASTTFAWTSSTSAGTITGNTTPGTGNVSDVLSNSATTSGTATYVVTPTGPVPTSCVGTPVNFVVTVNPTPTVTNATTTQSICSGSTALIVPTSGIASTTFAWTASASAGTITGFTSPGAGNISQILSNSASTIGTVTYIVTPTGPAPTSCVGTPVNFVVTVNPIPTVTNATTTQAICSGTTASITPTSGVASTTFGWTSSTSAGTITGNTTPGTGNVSDVLS